MLLPRLIGAVGLLSIAAHAAPKGTQFKDAFAARNLDSLPEPPRPHVLRTIFNTTNSTTSPAQQSTQTAVLPDGQLTSTLECPTVSLYVSTKLVDVTVYISGNTTVTSTVPCEDDVTKTVDDIVTEHCTQPHCTKRSTATTASGGLETIQTITNGRWNTTMTSVRSRTSTEPCDDDPAPGNMTMTTIHQTATPTEEPCDDITVTNTLTISGSATKVTSTIHRTLTSTEPCDDDLTMTPGGNYTMQTQTTQHASTTTEPFEVVTSTLTIGGSVTRITSTIHRTSISTEPCSDDTSMSSMLSTNTASFSNSTASAISTSSTGFAIFTNSTRPATSPTSTGSVTSPSSGTSASSTNTVAAGNATEATISQSSVSTTNGTAIGTSSTLSLSRVTSTNETATTSGTLTSLTASSDTTTTTTSSTTTSVSSTSATSSTTSSATTSSGTTTSSTSSTATTSSTPTATTPSPTTTSASTTTTQSIAPRQFLGLNAPAGAPEPNTVYCDIKGQPVGTNLISEIVEDGPGIDVTLEGCFQFCQNVTGCEAYRFFHDVPNRPRCALYSASISDVVRAIDRNDGNQWFDVLCGSPSEWIINYG